MKTLILAAIRCSLMFTAVTASLFSVRPAQAYTVTLEQLGSNVVATGSGAINLTGLFSGGGVNSGGKISGNLGVIVTGAPSLVNLMEIYGGGFTGPSSFGSGNLFFPNGGGGDYVGISGSAGLLIVPFGYVSGTALSDRMTFNNATLASLGVTPGTYVWSWGTGFPNQNFTLIIESGGGCPTCVPDGGSTVSLLGCALLGLAALRRKLPLLRGRKA